MLTTNKKGAYARRDAGWMMPSAVNAAQDWTLAL
jgi:hypothetical protein